MKLVYKYWIVSRNAIAVVKVYLKNVENDGKISPEFTKSPTSLDSVHFELANVNV